ncbi:MAG: hypothetical protein OXG05_03365 [Gammaproteobacteria bacterium]|nr:hypothetical protein [Gammaproteobacteria bacterium]
MSTQIIENQSTIVASHVQHELWPAWVNQHPWLTTFLPKAEAEARNQGFEACDHFCIQLAFLRLRTPVEDWFRELGVNVVQWREDLLVALGSNLDKGTLNRYIEVGKRIQLARTTENPVDELPLQRVTAEAHGMLDLAKSEAERDHVAIDERHFMVPIMDWHPFGEPAIEELRRITGRK